MRWAIGLFKIVLCVSVVAQAALCQQHVSAYSIDWYGGGANPGLLSARIQTSVGGTVITFFDQGKVPLKVAHFKVDGEETGISTVDGTFALFTNYPGVNLYLFRVKGRNVVKALECHGPYEPEVGPGWVMCFSGRSESKDRIDPTSATIYLLADNEILKSAETVSFDERYVALNRLIGKK